MTQSRSTALQKKRDVGVGCWGGGGGRRTPKGQNKRHIWNQRHINKEELQQRNRLGTISRKTTGELKPALFARNLTLNSHAAANYKYRIRPNYCTYPYKRTVKQFRSLQNTASVLLSACWKRHMCCGNPFELHRLVDAVQKSSHNICSYRENQEKRTTHIQQHRISIIW